MPLIVNNEACIACGTCVDECREGALFLEEETVVLKEEDCIQCGDCVAICVAGALELKK